MNTYLSTGLESTTDPTPDNKGNKEASPGSSVSTDGNRTFDCVAWQREQQTEAPLQELLQKMHGYGSWRSSSLSKHLVL